RLQVLPGHDSLLHMGGMDEDRNRVAHHTGSGVEIPGAKFAPRSPILQHLPDEPGHASRIVGDEVGAFGDDPAVKTVNLRVASELCALAAVERQHEAT